MNIKVIAYLAIASNYVNSTNGVNSRMSKHAISRCNSAPDLRVLYNTTAMATATTYTTASAYSTYKDANNIMSYEQYKSIIYNKYKRNIYLRSKEKYTFDANN